MKVDFNIRKNEYIKGASDIKFNRLFILRELENGDETVAMRNPAMADSVIVLKSLYVEDNMGWMKLSSIDGRNFAFVRYLTADESVTIYGG